MADGHQRGVAALDPRLRPSPLSLFRGGQRLVQLRSIGLRVQANQIAQIGGVAVFNLTGTSEPLARDVVVLGFL